MSFDLTTLVGDPVVSNFDNNIAEQFNAASPGPGDNSHYDTVFARPDTHQTAGKWYWESVVVSTPGSGNQGHGIGQPLIGSSGTFPGGDANSWAVFRQGIFNNNQVTSNSLQHTSGDVLRHSLDLDNGTYEGAVNGGAWQTITTSLASTTWAPFIGVRNLSEAQLVLRVEDFQYAVRSGYTAYNLTPPAFDPTTVSGTVTFNANNTVATGGGTSDRNIVGGNVATQHLSGVWYWESEVSNDSWASVGLAEVGTLANGAFLGAAPGQIGLWAAGDVYNGSTTPVQFPALAFTHGDVIRMLVDLDANTLSAAVNSGSLTQIATLDPTKIYAPAINLRSPHTNTGRFVLADQIYGIPTGAKTYGEQPTPIYSTLTPNSPQNSNGNAANVSISGNTVTYTGTANDGLHRGGVTTVNAVPQTVDSVYWETERISGTVSIQEHGLIRSGHVPPASSPAGTQGGDDNAAGALVFFDTGEVRYLGVITGTTLNATGVGDRLRHLFNTVTGEYRVAINDGPFVLVGSVDVSPANTPYTPYYQSQQQNQLGIYTRSSDFVYQSPANAESLEDGAPGTSPSLFLVDIETNEAVDRSDVVPAVGISQLATSDAIAPPHYDELFVDNGDDPTTRISQLATSDAIAPPHYDELFVDNGDDPTTRLVVISTNEAVVVDEFFYLFGVASPTYLTSPIIGII